MKYSFDQLPFDQFEKLGMKKDALLILPDITLNALLSGNRTSLIRFNKIPTENGPGQLDAKLSLKKAADGKLLLQVHPVQQEAVNTFNLSKKEVEKLKGGKLFFVAKKINDGDKTLSAMIAYDHTTNEYVAIEKDKLKAPDRINNVLLTPAQKKDFIKGEPVSIKGKTYRLNPTMETGISGPSLQSMQIGHSVYKMPNLYIDAALITAGLGHYFMLYHLANMLAHSRLKLFQLDTSLQKEAFRNDLAAAHAAILKSSPALAKTNGDELNNSTPKTLSADEIKTILEEKAGHHIVAGIISQGGMDADADSPNIQATVKPDSNDTDEAVKQSPRSMRL